MHIAPPDQPSLSLAERRRGLAVLLVSTFLTWAGFFVVVPLIAVHYVDGLGWAASSVGLVLAVRQFLQQGSTTLSGALADRLGAKGLICAGMLVRAAGFAIMAFADTYPLLMISAIVAALGGGLFESPKAAAIAALTTEENRRRFYSLAGVIAGIGVALGTQLGALLIGANFAAVSLAGAVTFFVTFALILLFLPSVQVASESHGVREGFAIVLRDRLFMTYVGLLMGYWFMATQFNLSLTLTAAEIAGTESVVAWIYGINSGVTILFGYTLPRVLERRVAALPMLVLGVVLTAAGMFAVGASHTMLTLFGSVVLISFGSVLMRPGEQTVTAKLARPVARGSYFGIAALSLAIGGGLGNYAGGIIYDLGQNHNLPALPWLIYGTVGTVTAAGLWWLGRVMRRHSASGSQVASAPVTAARARPE